MFFYFRKILFKILNSQYKYLFYFIGFMIFILLNILIINYLISLIVKGLIFIAFNLNLVNPFEGDNLYNMPYFYQAPKLIFQFKKYCINFLKKIKHFFQKKIHYQFVHEHYYLSNYDRSKRQILENFFQSETDNYFNSSSVIPTLGAPITPYQVLYVNTKKRKRVSLSYTRKSGKYQKRVYLQQEVRKGKIPKYFLKKHKSSQEYRQKNARIFIRNVHLDKYFKKNYNAIFNSYDYFLEKNKGIVESCVINGIAYNEFTDDTKEVISILNLIKIQRAPFNQHKAHQFTVYNIFGRDTYFQLFENEFTVSELSIFQHGLFFNLLKLYNTINTNKNISDIANDYQYIQIFEENEDYSDYQQSTKKYFPKKLKPDFIGFHFREKKDIENIINYTIKRFFLQQGQMYMQDYKEQKKYRIFYMWSYYPYEQERIIRNKFDLRFYLKERPRIHQINRQLINKLHLPKKKLFIMIYYLIT